MVKKEQILLISLFLLLFIIGIGVCRDKKIKGFLYNTSFDTYKNIENKLSSLVYILGLKKKDNKGSVAVQTKGSKINNLLVDYSKSKVGGFIQSVNDDFFRLSSKFGGEIKEVANCIGVCIKGFGCKVGSKMKSTIDFSESIVKNLVSSANDDLSSLSFTFGGEVKNVANYVGTQVKGSAFKVGSKIKGVVDISKSKIKNLVSSTSDDFSFLSSTFVGEVKSVSNYIGIQVRDSVCKAGSKIKSAFDFSKSKVNYVISNLSDAKEKNILVKSPNLLNLLYAPAKNESLPYLARKFGGKVKTVTNNIGVQVKGFACKTGSQIKSAADFSKLKVKLLVSSANENLSNMACSLEGKVKEVSNYAGARVKSSACKVGSKIKSAVDFYKSKVKNLGCKFAGEVKDIAYYTGVQAKDFSCKAGSKIKGAIDYSKSKVDSVISILSDAKEKNILVKNQNLLNILYIPKEEDSLPCLVYRFGAQVKDSVGKVGSKIKRAIDDSKSKVENLVSSVSDDLSSLSSTFGGEVKEVANYVGAQVKGSACKVRSKVKNAADGSKSKIKYLVSRAKDNLSNIACSFEDKVKGATNYVGTQVKGSACKVRSKIKSIFDSAKDSLSHIACNFEGQVKDKMQVKRYACEVESKIKSVINVPKPKEEKVEFAVQSSSIQRTDVPREKIEDENIPIIVDNQEVNCGVKDEICKTVLRKKEVACHTLFLGKLYNHSLVEFEVINGELQKRWIVNASIYGNSVYDTFNSCGKVVPLSNLLFCPFTIEDIFLLSKLSNEGKIYLFDACILNPEYRNIRENQYLAYIAPFKVNMVCCTKERGGNFGGICRFSCGCEKKIVCGLGFNIPIKSCSHIIDLNFIGVNQKKNGFTEAQLDFVAADFNKNYIDIYDFFCREILAPKNLCFKERQNKVGVGDISFFALFDIAHLFDRIDGLQINLDLSIPSGGKYEGKNIWEVVLGNGGATQLGLSVDSLIRTSKNYINPSISLGGKFSFEFSSCRRVPQLKSSDVSPGQPLKDVKDLIVTVFKAYSVRPFCEYDSCVKYFADQAFLTKTKLGSIFYFSLGNYFYNLFKKCFNLNVFYDFLYKGKDCVRVCAKTGTFNTDLLERCTDIRSHQISWNLGYVSGCGIEFNVGSRHIIAGKNYPKTNEWFVSRIANF